MSTSLAHDGNPRPTMGRPHKVSAVAAALVLSAMVTGSAFAGSVQGPPAVEDNQVTPVTAPSPSPTKTNTTVLDSQVGGNFGPLRMD